MAAKTFIPTTATPVKKQMSWTFDGTWEATDLVRVTLTGEKSSITQTLEVVVNTTTLNDVVTAVKDAINAKRDAGDLSYSLFWDVTATASNAVLTIEANTAGEPFYASLATVESGGGAADAQTISAPTTRANVGPEDWNCTLNWTDSAVPANGDEVSFTGQSQASVRFGLNQSGVTLARLNIERGFRSPYQLGTPGIPLQIGVTLTHIGDTSGDNSVQTMSSLINIDYGSVQNTTVVLGSATVGVNGMAPIQLNGTHASNVLSVSGGALVGWGTSIPGASGAVTITCTSGRVEAGSGVDIKGGSCRGGHVEGEKFTAGTFEQFGGTVRINGNTAVNNYKGYAGTCYANHRPATMFTNLTTTAKFTFDFSERPVAGAALVASMASYALSGVQIKSAGAGSAPTLPTGWEYDEEGRFGASSSS